MAKARDEFTKTTVDRLARRAGYICAYPGCRQLTVGPSEDRVSGLTMVGVAAHITAAAEGGPRYEKDLKPEERADESNGVWMCQLHGKLIDDNASRNTVAELKRWKSQHEDWVFKRVASADSVIKHGLTSVTIENLGPFQDKTTIALGRHNVAIGRNGSGKSTLCETIGAFAGGHNLEAFSERWTLFGPHSPGMAISAATSVEGVRRTVLLSEEKIGLRPPPERRQKRLHVEVDGNISGHWPRSLFNVLILDKRDRSPSSLKDAFRTELRAIAAQLNLNEDQIWDGLREELFCSAPFGSRIRRTGQYRIEVQTASHDSFLPIGNLSGSERTIVVLDIALRLLRADPRPTPWILIIESGMFLGLDKEGQKHVVRTLKDIEGISLQTIVCVNSQEQVMELVAGEDGAWIGSSTHGDLTVHAFQ